jgi:hypothetical protein
MYNAYTFYKLLPLLTYILTEIVYKYLKLEKPQNLIPTRESLPLMELYTREAISSLHKSRIQLLASIL